MVIFGAIVNAISVVFGAGVGTTFGHLLKNNTRKGIMTAVALVVIFIGIQGALETDDLIVMVLSLVIGTLIGETVDFDGKFNHFALRLQERVANEGESTFQEAFVSATLFVVVGAMAIIGSLQSGLFLDHTTMYAKSILDFVFVFVLSSTLGIGSAFAAIPLFIYEAALSLLSASIAPLLGDVVTTEIGAVGSLIIMGLGVNLLQITDIKVMNIAPSMFVPIVLIPLFNLF